MPLLPRVAQKPDRLQLLREQAFSRLLVEEARVTRRRAMMLVAGAAAVGLRGKALAVPGPRSAAPQYGAPGIYGNPPDAKPTSFVDRDALGSLAAWKDGRATVLKDHGQKGAGYLGYGASDRVRNLYYMPSVGDPILMSLITEKGYSYVVLAGQTFYANDGVDLVGLRWGTDELIVTPSLFKMKTPANGDAGVVENFELMMNDVALQRAAAPKRAEHISLAGAIPPAALDHPAIVSGEVDKGILKLGTTYNATFVIDLQRHKLVSYDPGGRSYR